VIEEAAAWLEEELAVKQGVLEVMAVPNRLAVTVPLVV
jgi:hypothetical protein